VASHANRGPPYLTPGDSEAYAGFLFLCGQPSYVALAWAAPCFIERDSGRTPHMQPRRGVRRRSISPRSRSEAFHADLAASGLLERVLVMAFSEFGRRVAENGSAGTEHGTSGPVFLAGTHIQSGLIGSYPSLTDLVDGDLKMTVDFRRVYATVLEDWLGLESKNALNGTFERALPRHSRFVDAESGCLVVSDRQGDHHACARRGAVRTRGLRLAPFRSAMYDLHRVWVRCP
jgi:Protein of unknown function (DUF1501)